MRLVAIPALLLLALAGLAIVPEAAAAPPEPPCNGTIAVTRTVGPVTVFASPPCYTVSVDPGCIHGDWYGQSVGRLTVNANVCEAPTPPSTASSQPPCTCPPPPMCRPVVTDGPLSQIVSVTVTSDCRVIVDILTPLIACTEPLDGTWVITQGRVTVTAPCKPDFDPCEPPFECYPASPASAQVPPVCIWKEAEAGPVKAGVDQCRQSHETNTCSNGSPQRIHRYEQVGPVYAQVHFCFPHSPPPDLGAAASESGPCGAAGLQQRCPAPVPLCSGVKDPVEGAVDVDVSPGCHVLVTVDLIDCLWGETWVYHTVGPVTVGYTTCRSPDAVSADPLADPFPSCVAAACGLAAAPAIDACPLQSATPTSIGPAALDLRRLAWGSDASECDVDVEPIGACAPPSGKTVERRVAFVHVTLLICGGGIGDGWS